METAWKAGLEDVIAARSAICRVDGEAGRLYYRGYEIGDARGDPRVRVPGFGHRVYKVDDARARVLRGMAKSMAEATGRQRLFDVAERVYDAMRARTTLSVNVDFFSAVVYDALGISPDFCTSIFAVGPGRGVVRARAGAIRRQPAHPAPGRVRRPGTASAPGTLGAISDSPSFERGLSPRNLFWGRFGGGR